MKNLDDTNVENIVRTKRQAANKTEVPHLNEKLEIEYFMVPDINHVIRFPINPNMWEGSGPYKANVTLAELGLISTPIITIGSVTDSVREALMSYGVYVKNVSITDYKIEFGAEKIPEHIIPIVVYGVKGEPKGSWIDVVGAVGGGKKINIVQIKGQSTEDVMSQKAVTDELDGLDTSLKNLKKDVDTLVMVAGGGRGYIHVQDTPSKVWMVNHELGSPSVTSVFGTDGVRISGYGEKIDTTDLEWTELSFSIPMVGMAVFVVVSDTGEQTPISVVQETGQSMINVMSQKATTDALNNGLNNKLDKKGTPDTVRGIDSAGNDIFIPKSDLGGGGGGLLPFRALKDTDFIFQSPFTSGTALVGRTEIKAETGKAIRGWGSSMGVGLPTAGFTISKRIAIGKGVYKNQDNSAILLAGENFTLLSTYSSSQAVKVVNNNVEAIRYWLKTNLKFDWTANPDLVLKDGTYECGLYVVGGTGPGVSDYSMGIFIDPVTKEYIMLKGYCIVSNGIPTMHPNDIDLEKILGSLSSTLLGTMPTLYYNYFGNLNLYLYSMRWLGSYIRPTNPDVPKARLNINVRQMYAGYNTNSQFDVYANDKLIGVALKSDNSTLYPKLDAIFYGFITTFGSHTIKVVPRSPGYITPASQTINISPGGEYNITFDTGKA